MTIKPQVTRGALVRLDGSPDPTTGDAVVFELNPDRLLRRVASGPDGRHQEVISFTLALDATETLEAPDSSPGERDVGVYPILAALEMFVSPAPPERQLSWIERLMGARAYTPPPLALFVWGQHRAVPVRVTRLDIAEELHDPRLSPIHASVDVRLQVVTDLDLPNNEQVGDIWRRYRGSLQRLSQWGYQRLP